MNIALILSGGIGMRLGSDIPKQYIKINGKPVIFYCLETILQHPEIDGVQIVAEKCWQQFIVEEIEKQRAENGADTFTGEMWKQKFRGFSAPGTTRQLSIVNGLEDSLVHASEEDTVLIHDAARPCVTADLISQGFFALRGHDGVLPVLPMKDTIYSSRDGKMITSLLNRNQLFAGQAPEFFRIGKYYEANKALFPTKIMEINGSTEPAILAGLDVVMIPGLESNFKITTRTDLEQFKQWVLQKACPRNDVR